MNFLSGFFKSLEKLLNGEINRSPEEIARRAHMRDQAGQNMDRRLQEERKGKTKLR